MGQSSSSFKQLLLLSGRVPVLLSIGGVRMFTASPGPVYSHKYVCRVASSTCRPEHISSLLWPFYRSEITSVCQSLPESKRTSATLKSADIKIVNDGYGRLKAHYDIGAS